MPLSIDQILNDEKLREEDVAALPQTVHIELPHLPVVILLDTSESMSGDAIGQVNQAMTGFFSDVVSPSTPFHRKLQRQGDFCVITYGETVQTFMPWTSGAHLSANLKFSLRPYGRTPMGAAMVQSAELLLARYRGYKQTNTRAFCGLVFNLTDGEPTDMAPDGSEDVRNLWEKAKECVRLFEVLGSQKNPYAQYIHFGTSRKSCEALHKFAGETPLPFLPGGGSEEDIHRVNLLEGAESFSRFVRYIEMSLNSIISSS
jgi:uncharacterized protein YegL